MQNDFYTIVQSTHVPSATQVSRLVSIILFNKCKNLSNNARLKKGFVIIRSDICHILIITKYLGLLWFPIYTCMSTHTHTNTKYHRYN